MISGADTHKLNQPAPVIAQASMTPTLSGSLANIKWNCQNAIWLQWLLPSCMLDRNEIAHVAYQTRRPLRQLSRVQEQNNAMGGS